MKPPAPTIQCLNLTLPEFCATVGISRQAFYRLATNDRPRLTRIRGKYLISREAMHEWLDAHTDKPNRAK